MTETSVIVRRYKIRVPDGSDAPAWAQDCEDELKRANALWNRLVEIDREFAARYAAITADEPEVAAAQQEYEAALAALAEAQAARNKERQRTRSRGVSLDVMNELRDAKLRTSQARARLKAAKAAARIDRAPDRQALEMERRRAVADARRASGVYWATANAVVLKFEAARKRMIRMRAEGKPAEMRFRRYSGGSIANQYPGGMSLAKFRDQVLNDDARSRIVITAFSTQDGEPREITRTRNGKVETVLWRGPGEQRPLEVPLILGRNAPQPWPDSPDVRVKQVELVMRRNPDWLPLPNAPKHKQWLRGREQSCFVVTATVPAGEEIERCEPKDECAAINVGWRLLPDGGIRVATIVGSDTREADFVVLPPELLDLHRRQRDLDSERDRLLDDIMLLVKGIAWAKAPVPALAEFGSNLARAPKFGQRSLARLTVAWMLEMPDWLPEAWCRLEEWRQADNRLRSRQDAARRRFFGRRRELYRLAARGIAMRYGHIIMDKMDIAEMVRLPKDDDPEMEQAVRSRRMMAAPGELRAAILQAAKKFGRTVELSDDPATRICHVGLERGDEHEIHPIDPAELMYDCPQCSARERRIIRFDQDVNNCRVRLARWRANGPAAPETTAAVAAE